MAKDIVTVNSSSVACEGNGPVTGHPKVYLTIKPGTPRDRLPLLQPHLRPGARRLDRARPLTSTRSIMALCLSGASGPLAAASMAAGKEQRPARGQISRRTTEWAQRRFGTSTW